MAKKRIVVIVKGGLVQEVYSSDIAAVEIIDQDGQTEAEQKAPGYSLEDLRKVY